MPQTQTKSGSKTAVYEPFYRVDDTRAASGGNGLGLYVVRELLKKEGFRYVFEPVEDGMRFTIFL